MPKEEDPPWLKEALASGRNPFTDPFTVHHLLGECEALKPLGKDKRETVAFPILVCTDKMGPWSRQAEVEKGSRLQALATVLNERFKLSDDAAFTTKKIGVVWAWLEKMSSWQNIRAVERES